MLVLSRKKNESVVINNDIIVTVVEIRSDKVRLGFVHPRDTSVHRLEVYEAIHGRPPAESSLTFPAPETQAVAPLEPPKTPDGPPSLLDRVIAALQARVQIAFSRELLTQVIAEAAVQELSAEVVQSTSPERLKSLLLDALKARV